MSNFSSNCYGFVYAWLKNSEEEFFKDIDDLKLRKAEIKGKIDERIMDTSDAIKEVFSLNDFSQEYKILQLFDDERRSQHVAFIDSSGKFYDQNGPDGEVRLKRKLGRSSLSISRSFLNSILSSSFSICWRRKSGFSIS